MFVGVALAEDALARSAGEDFSDALREAHLSQKAASLLMEVPESHITDMIQGRRHIPTGKLLYLGFKFASAFVPRFMDRATRVLSAVYSERA